MNKIYIFDRPKDISVSPIEVVGNVFVTKADEFIRALVHCAMHVPDSGGFSSVDVKVDTYGNGVATGFNPYSICTGTFDTSKIAVDINFSLTPDVIKAIENTFLETEMLFVTVGNNMIRLVGDTKELYALRGVGIASVAIKPHKPYIVAVFEPQYFVGNNMERFLFASESVQVGDNPPVPADIKPGGTADFTIDGSCYNQLAALKSILIVGLEGEMAWLSCKNIDIKLGTQGREIL